MCSGAGCLLTLFTLCTLHGDWWRGSCQTRGEKGVRRLLREEGGASRGHRPKARSGVLQTEGEGPYQGGVHEKVPEDGRLKSESVLTAVNNSQCSQGGICFLLLPHQLPGKQPPPHGGRAPPPDHGTGQEGQRGRNQGPRVPARSEGRDT